MKKTRKLSISDLARNMADFINRVSYKGERFTIVRGGKPVAELSPVTSGAKLSELKELVAGLPSLSEKESLSFSKDLAEVSSEERHLESNLRDPWE